MLFISNLEDNVKRPLMEGTGFLMKQPPRRLWPLGERGSMGKGCRGMLSTQKAMSRDGEVNLPPYKALRLKWIR